MGIVPTSGERERAVILASAIDYAIQQLELVTERIEGEIATCRGAGRRTRLQDELRRRRERIAELRTDRKHLPRERGP